MSPLAIVTVVVAALIVLLFAGGLLAVRRRAAASGDELRLRIAAADRALEAARAADRGWDRAAIEQAARAALERERPGVRFDSLHLVLVEDRPGIAEDRAQVAAQGVDGEVRVVLVRRGETWHADGLV